MFAFVDIAPTLPCFSIPLSKDGAIGNTDADEEEEEEEEEDVLDEANQQ